MPEAEAKIPKKLQLVVSTSPHIKSLENIPRIMWRVSLVLAPAAIMGVVYFGLEALITLALCIGSAVGTEALIQKLMKKKVTVHDGSAFLTGLLLAMVISPSIVTQDPNIYGYHVNQIGPVLTEILSRNLYIPIIGAFFAIAIVKHAFGGLGCNIWNPALAGRAFILAAWPLLLTGIWPNIEQVKTSPDAPPPAVTSATIRRERKALLAEARYGSDKLPALKGETDSARAIELIEQELVKRKTTDKPNGDDRGKWYLKLLVGWRDGSLGETCGLWLIIGGIILIALRYIDWRVPVFFIGSAVLLGWALPVKVLPDQAPAMFTGNPVFDLLTGGLLLGAFFMATDMVTSPLTKRGAVIFGLGCGILTALIRVYGGYPEGVCYAILLMNTAVPLIDRYTRPRVFGTVK